MKQQPYYRNHRDEDDDDDDDRKPPARTSEPQSSQPSSEQSNYNNNSNNRNDADDEEEYYSESGACSHTSSTAMASVDHSSLHETTTVSSVAVRHRNSGNHRPPYWWNQVLSPFRSSSTFADKTTAYDVTHPLKQSQQRHSNCTSDDYIYQTPTNASMINAIRNEIHDSTAIPNLTFATPYTPDVDTHHHLDEDGPYNKTNATRSLSTVPPSKVSTSTTPTVTGQTKSKMERNTLTTNSSNGTATPTSPVEQITNTTITTLQRNTILYVGSTTLAWMILFAHILPSVVLYTLLWIIVSTLLMIQAFYTTIQEYYYHMVVMGPGLGSMLLPQSVYNLLTQESLHEFLTDEVMVLEYRHLLLYFLPISSTQLRDLLRRIAPQHQQRLQRRGEIGTLLFGESIMRIILGHAQYEQWRNRQSVSPSSSSNRLLEDGNTGTRTNTPQAAAPQQRQQATLLLSDSFDDEQSDLGLDISSDDMIGGSDALAERLGLVEARTMSSPMPSIVINNNRPLPNEVITTTSSNPATPNTTNSDAVRATTYDDQEYQVLMDALWDSFYGAIWNPITDYVQSTYMIPMLHRLSRVTFHTGIVLLSISTGNAFGLWGWSYQIMYQQLRMYIPARGLLLSNTTTQQSRDTTTSNSASSSNQRLEPTLSNQAFGLFSRPSATTWSTALLGSASLGLSYYSRRSVRRYHMAAAILDANHYNEDNAAASPKTTPATSTGKNKTKKKE